MTTWAVITSANPWLVAAAAPWSITAAFAPGLVDASASVGSAVAAASLAAPSLRRRMSPWAGDTSLRAHSTVAATIMGHRLRRHWLRLAAAAQRTTSLGNGRGSDTAQAFVDEFRLRLTVGKLAADALAHASAAMPTTVIATSLAAREVFAAAKRRGARTVLLFDLPHLLALNCDLDRAAQCQPQSRWLRNARAPSWAIVRQRAELLLADEVVVRSDYVRNLLQRDGQSRTRVQPPTPATIAQPASAPNAPILLGHGAAARSGFRLAADAAAALGRTLVARRCDATEAHDANHPAVRWYVGAPPACAAVVLPACCELTPAVDPRSLPIVASRFVTQVSLAHHECDATVAALVATLARVLDQPAADAPAS